MLRPPSPATSRPASASTTPTAPARAARDGTAFRAAVDARKSATSRTHNPRKRVAARDGDADKKPPAWPALLPRTDGALMVPVGLGPALAELRGITSPAARAGKPTAVTPPPPVALTDVRVGGAPGTARLHATLAEGRHVGVELRAVEHRGRVTIELHAPSAEAALALRAELPAVREALSARGLEGVSVEVHAGDEGDRQRGRAPQWTGETEDRPGAAVRGVQTGASAPAEDDLVF